MLVDTCCVAANMLKRLPRYVVALLCYCLNSYDSYALGFAKEIYHLTHPHTPKDSQCSCETEIFKSHIFIQTLAPKSRDIINIWLGCLCVNVCMCVCVCELGSLYTYTLLFCRKESMTSKTFGWFSCLDLNLHFIVQLQ